MTASPCPDDAAVRAACRAGGRQTVKAGSGVFRVFLLPAARCLPSFPRGFYPAPQLSGVGTRFVAAQYDDGRTFPEPGLQDSRTDTKGCPYLTPSGKDGIVWCACHGQPSTFSSLLMDLAFFRSSCASVWAAAHWLRSAACLPLSSALWTIRHAGGTGHCRTGLSVCRASRPWSWRLMSAPARSGAKAAGPRALPVPQAVRCRPVGQRCSLSPPCSVPTCRASLPFVETTLLTGR